MARCCGGCARRRRRGKDDESRARTTWDTLSPGKRRDFIEWITGAKRAETKERRLAAAIELLEEGKSLNWKYEKR